MKYIFTVFFFASFFSFSAEVDSVLHKGEWYKIYPYEQISGVSRMRTNRYSWQNKFKLQDGGINFGAMGVSSDIFQPLQELPDGKYLQVVKLDEYDLLEGKIYARRSRRVKPIKLKELNALSDTSIIYGVFSIVDSKLEGDVRFLSPVGDTLIFGQYSNNLRQGKWVFGKQKHITREFKDGLRHGLSTLVTRSRKDEFLETLVWENGVKKSKSTQSTNKWGFNRTEETFGIEGDQNYLHYKEFRNDVLREEGDKFYKNKVGEWKYYSSSGQLIAQEKYWDKSIRIKSAFRAWHSGLPEAFVGRDVPEINMFCYYRDNYAQLWRGRPGDFGSHKSIYCAGDGEYWHPATGNKWFTYAISDSGVFVPGTLYHSNGNPRYTFSSDSLFSEYVCTYYDENGVETHRTTEPWNEPSKKYGTEIIRYNRKNLFSKWNKRQGSHYKYKKMPEWEELSEEEDEILEAVLRHDGDRLVTQTYYILDNNIKVHQENFGPTKKDGYNYKLEIRQIFNEDYTEANTRTTLIFKDDFKIVQTFKVKYNKNQYKEHLKDLYEDKDPSGINNVLASNYRGYQRKPDGTFFKGSDVRNFNFFFEQMGEITDLETVYTYEGKPLNGTVEIDKGREGSFKKVGKNKYKITVDYDQGSYFQSLKDGFGMVSSICRYDLLPDLHKDLRLPGYLQYGTNHLSTIEGSFKNGKIDGNWKGYNSSKKLVLDATYSEGEISGKAQIYYWKKKRKYKKGKYQVERGESRKVIIPERHFVNYEAEYGPNGIENFRKLGLDGGVMASGNYKDGKCFYYENGYEHYELIEAEKLFGNYLSYNSDTPPTAEDHNATKKFYYDENGLLEKIEVDRPGKAEDREKFTFNFDEGSLHGPYELEFDKGTFKHGIYTGTIKNDAGNGKHVIQHLVNGIVVKEELYNEDYKLSQVIIDTSRFKLQGNISRLYRLTAKVPNKPVRDDYTPADTTKKALFTSFYADGTKRAEGIYWSVANKKDGVWKYYRPDGTLKNEVEYDYGKFGVAGKDSMRYQAILTEFENDKPIYEAYVIKIISKYNCNLADNYESRQLVMMEDFEAKKTFPSRPLKIYYETGVLQAEGELVDGIPQGLWKFYDSQGGLRATGLYKDGERSGRWLIGDLTNAAFIGDFCLNPLAYKFDPNYESELKKNLSIEIVIYHQGTIQSTTSIKTYLNNQ